MATPKLPLRPDGGIDFLKLEVLHDPQGDLRYFYNGTWLQEEDFIAATLERVAKWHEEQEIFWGRCVSASRENEQTSYDTFDVFVRGRMEAHKASAVTIRAMKP